MPLEDDTTDTEWADTVDFRLLMLERSGKTLRLGVIVGIGSGVAGVAMSLILGKTVAKLADSLGQLGQITQAMMVELNGPTQGGRPMATTGGTGAPGPDVPPPSADGAARVFLGNGAIDETRTPPEGSVVGAVFEGPASELSAEDRAALEAESIVFKEPGVDAGSALILDDDDIKPVGG